MQTIRNPIYSIYKIINLINGKLYIGCTFRTLEERFYGHIRRYKTRTKKDIILYNAFHKHGIENFKIELIETVDTIDEMYEREKYYIKTLDTFHASGKGYNMTLGGEGNAGYEWTEEQRKNKRKERKLLFEKCPDLKQKFLMAGQTAIKKQNEKYKVIDPDNNIHEGIGSHKLCEKYNLNPFTFRYMLQGKQKQHKGWILYKPEFENIEEIKKFKSELFASNKKFKVLSPEGKLIEGQGTTEFCKNNKLNHPSFYNLINGKILYYKGWRLPETPPKPPKIKKVKPKKIYNSLSDCQKKFIFEVISPDGILYEEKGIAEFCKKHHLKRPNIIAVLNGRRKSCNGWHLP